MSKEAADVIIVGSGPAGLAAALYGQRLGLSTVVFGDTPGGNLYMVERLNNFPAFADGIGGTEFGLKLFQQAQAAGTRFTMTRLASVSRRNGQFQATDGNGGAWTAPAVIVASGRSPKPLPGQEEPLNGVNFCSVCNGPLYRNQNAVLAVVGGDNVAAQHALTLSSIAKTVLLIHRGPDAHNDQVHKTLLSERDNIQTIPETEVLRFVGGDCVEAVEVRSPGRPDRQIPVNGVFLAIGWKPNTDMIDFPIDATDDGAIKTNACLMSSVPGLFAAGDVRDTDLRQVLAACADGARAAHHAAAYITARQEKG
jgi:thioredoxin reductase (NADPH)